MPWLSSLKNLAISLGEESGTIEEVYEPFLIQEGYISRTPSGRVATPLAAQKFGIMKKRPDDHLNLFQE